MKTIKRSLRWMLTAASLFIIVLSAHSQQAVSSAYIQKASVAIVLQNDTIKLNGPIDGQVLTRVAGVWTNGNSGGAGAAAVDSLLWDFSTGDLGWYIGGSIAGTENLDGRYVEYPDSTIIYATPYQLEQVSNASKQVVYTLDMPVGTSVLERINGTTPPPGWTLSTTGLDLIITHNMGRNSCSVQVWADTGNDILQELIGTSAYSSLLSYAGGNQVQISSLATIQTPINVYISFAQ